MELSQIISSMALLVAIASVIIVWAASKNQENLSHQEIEWLRIQISNAKTKHSNEQNADMSARMYVHGKNNWKVKLYNKGPGDAFDIRLDLTKGSNFLIKAELDGKLPMKRIEKGHSVEFIAAVCMDSPLKEDITIIWRDKNNDENRKTVTLTL